MPERKYRWTSPHEWLEEKMGSMDFPSVVDVAHTLIHHMDADTLQDIFQDEMDEDGFFDEDMDWFEKSNFWQNGEDLDPTIPDLGREGDCVYLANPKDIFCGGGEPWYERFFLVTMSEFGPVVYVNADHMSDAIDFAIDFAEEMEWEGLFLGEMETEELGNRGALDNYVAGGSHGRYLSSLDVSYRLVKRGGALCLRS